MRNLGLAHDIGKITGTAKPEKSLTVLAQCGVDHEFLALVKWHDTGLLVSQLNARTGSIGQCMETSKRRGKHGFAGR